METNYLEFVKEFYQTGWNHLTWIITGAFVAGGIILPLVLNHINSRANKSEFNFYKKELDKEIDKLKDEIAEIKRKDRMNNGQSYMTQAIFFNSQQKDLTSTILSCLYAIGSFLQAKSDSDIAMVFMFISMLPPEINGFVSSLQNPLKETVQQTIFSTIESMKQNNENNKYSRYIEILEKIGALK